MLIVNQGLGSTAELAHPGKHSATYQGHIQMPLTLGAPGSIYNGPGFGIEVITAFPATHALRVRVSPGPVAITPFEFNLDEITLSTDVTETGSTTWAPSEKLCMVGTWPYSKLQKKQESIFEATYALAEDPITATWTVDGNALADAAGTVTLTDKLVLVANRKLNSGWTTRPAVNLRYEIETLPKGSRLRLFNNPKDQTFDVDVHITLATTVGSVSREYRTRFEGVVYKYPDEFIDAYESCIARVAAVGHEDVKFKILLPPDFWKRVPDKLVLEVESLLNAMGALRSQADRSGYQQAHADLRRVIGRDATQVRVLSLTRRARVTPYPGDQPSAGISNRG
jgi:hypothetical protein